MQTQQTRRTRIGKHLRRNVVAYLALMLAVTMSPLPSWAAGKIGTKDIKNGAVTTKKIKNNAVKSSKIKAGSVKTSDLGDGAVVAGKFGTIVEVVAESSSVGDGLQGGVTANCPDGAILIGGGFDAGGNAVQWRVQRSHKDGNGWRAFGTNQTGDPSTLEAKAYCLAP